MSGRTSWTLAQALTWIVEQRHSVRLECDDKTSVVGLQIQTLIDAETSITADELEDAKLELTSQLTSGRLHAYAVRYDNDDEVVIPSKRWPHLQIDEDAHGADSLSYPIMKGSTLAVPVYHSVCLSVSDVKARWPAPPPKGSRNLRIVPLSEIPAPVAVEGRDELPPIIIRTFDGRSGTDVSVEASENMQPPPQQSDTGNSELLVDPGVDFIHYTAAEQDILAVHDELSRERTLPHKGRDRDTAINARLTELGRSTYTTRTIQEAIKKRKKAHKNEG